MENDCEIIEMPPQSYLSDADIDALIQGVIKLIKKYASAEQIERLLARDSILDPAPVP